MSHTHWPEALLDRLGIPRELVQVCYLTRKECDALWTAYLHRHEGRPCEKQVLPGNKTQTCILQFTPEELEARLSKKVRQSKED